MSVRVVCLLAAAVIGLGARPVAAREVTVPGASVAAGATRLQATPAGAACAEPDVAPGSACDDGDACTHDDVCADGVCTGTAVDCSDGDVCNGVETCDAATGACRPGEALACDDGDPCTDAACDPQGGCVFPRLPAPDFLRCRAAGGLPIPACRDDLPRGIRRAVVRLGAFALRIADAWPERVPVRRLVRLEHRCGRVKRRLESASPRRGGECLVLQGQVLDGLCPDRILLGPAD